MKKRIAMFLAAAMAANAAQERRRTMTWTHLLVRRLKAAPGALGKCLTLAFFLSPLAVLGGFLDDDLSYRFESGSTTQVYVDSLRNSSATSITIPATVVYEYYDQDDRDENYNPRLKRRTCTVTRIQGYAFSKKTSLRSVTIKNGLTSIGKNAFNGCSSLTSVTIPDSVTKIEYRAFYKCSSLTSVTIPNRVTSVGERTFYECGSLMSVTIPDSVTSIGDGAFYECSSLMSVTIPDSVASIGENAFAECGGLTSVTIGSGVTSIGNGAFAGCRGLTNVAIPEGVTSIGDSVFYYCTNLTSVTIPDSVTGIGVQAFSNCRGLTNVAIPDLVTSIGNGAFAGCRGLTNVAIPEGVTSIEYGTFSECVRLESVTIPATVTSIGEYAFYYCTNLTSVTIPDSVTSIGVAAFSYCTGLTSVTIPDSVTNIGSSAFSGCSGLTSVTIPDSVTSVGGWVFSYCDALKYVLFEGNPPEGSGQIVPTDSECVGKYLAVHKSAWEDVIDNGYWRGLKMTELKTTYTISYNANGGEGCVNDQTGKLGDGGCLVDDGSGLYWEEHYFMGWAFAPDGEVVYKAGDYIAEPTGDDMVTLYAKWLPNLTLSPVAVDWLKGSITLELGNATGLAGKPISLWCRMGGSDTAEWKNIQPGDGDVEIAWLGENRLGITDNAFLSRFGNIAPIEYCVKDEFGREAVCLARESYAVAVGIDRYSLSIDPKNKYELEGNEAYAEMFTNLAMNAGVHDGCARALKGPYANKENLDKIISFFAEQNKPGNIFLLYFATHGNGAGILLHDGEYSRGQLLADLQRLGDGVAVVGLMHACGSGGFALGLDDSMPNTGWITATDSALDSTFGLYFSEFLLDYGWKGGWAGTAGDVLTFGKLAGYMGKSYDRFFSGLVMDGNAKEIQAGIYNPNLLNKICLGKCPEHSGVKPADFTVTASTDRHDGVALDGFSIPRPTDGAVFYRFASDGKGYSLVKAKAKWENGNLVWLLVEKLPDNSRYPTQDDPLEFIVKAYNGAGVTAAAPTQGWRTTATLTARDGRNWSYGKVDGGVTIVGVSETLPDDGKSAGDANIPSIIEDVPVVSIAAHAFAGHKSFTSATIPDSVASIGEEAFEDCSGLTNVTIGSGVASVGEKAFAGCEFLASVTFLGDAPTLGAHVFAAVHEDCIVTVPKDSAGWGEEIPEDWANLKIQYASKPVEPVEPDETGEPEAPVAGPVVEVPVPEAVHVATAEAAPVETSAAEYNGFLKDAAGKIAGSVQLKLAKAGKDGTSKVTGTVQLGSKKEKVSGTYKDGVLSAAGFSNVTLDFNGITATYKAYSVDGARNVFTAKDAASKNQASAAMKAYKGAYTVAWQEGGVWGGVTVTVANKGKAKVAGFLPDGTKVGADGQLMLGDGTACMTLVSKNKRTPLGFNLWLTGGKAVVDGLGSDTHAAKVGALSAGKSFTCSLLGNPVPVMVAGKKWSVTTDKATALKLTFNAKAGSFKGSFKAGKQKVTVNGVVVNGVGYGSAVIKKGAKAAATIE